MQREESRGTRARCAARRTALTRNANAGRAVTRTAAVLVLLTAAALGLQAQAEPPLASGNAAPAEKTGAPANGGQVLRYDFSKVAGDVVPDLSGKGNDGRLVNNPTVNGDGSLQLNGYNQYVSVPGLSSFRVDQGLTIAAVVKFEDSSIKEPDCYDMILWKTDCFLLSRGQDGRLYFNIHDGKKWACPLKGGAALPLGRYVHVAATADFVDDRAQGFVGYQVVLWVNGEPVASGRFNNIRFSGSRQAEVKVGYGFESDPASLASVKAEGGIGKGWGGPWFFKGRMAAVSVYDRALSEGEIAAAAQRSPLVKGLRLPLVLPPETRARLDRLAAAAAARARGGPWWRVWCDRSAAAAAGEEARWLVDIAANLARDLRFSERSGALLDCVEKALREGEDVTPTSRQVAEGGLRILETPGLRVALVLAPGKCEVAGVYDRVQKRELLGDLPALWAATFALPDGKEIKIDASSAVSTLEGEGNDSFSILWTHAATPDEPVDFSVTGELRPNGRRLEMSLSLANRSPDAVLLETVFPTVAFRRLEAGPDVMVNPYEFGQAQADPVRNTLSYTGIYPSSHATLQFGAYHDERGGVYFAAEDPRAQTKTLSMSGKAGCLHAAWTWPVGHSGKGGNGFATSGRAVIEAFDGDWFDAGQLYKRWLSGHAPWFPSLPRADTPAWYRDLSVQVSEWDLGRIAKELPELREYLGLPIGVRWYAWMEHKSFDRWYPHFVAYDGFVPLVKDLQKQGVRVIPYMNYRLWDTKWRNEKEREEYERIARPSAVKDRSGQLYTEKYNSLFAVMCPAAPGYQQKMRGEFERVAGYGVDGLYLDQMCAGRPIRCFDPGHGHTLGGNDNWLENGYWKYLARFREELKRSHPDLIFEGEGMAEPYARLVDGFMANVTFQLDPGARRLPLFPSIYAGRVQFTGRNVSNGDPVDQASYFHKLGEMLVQGEQIAPTSLFVTLGDEKRKAFLKAMAHTRQALLPYFNAGEMARPLKLEGVPTVSADWGYHGRRILDSPAVLNGVWKRGDSLAIVFVNITSEAITTDVPLAGAIRGIGAGKPALYRCEGAADQSAAEPLDARAQAPLRLEPYGVAVWMIGDASPDAEARGRLEAMSRILREVRAYGGCLRAAERGK
jgi:hypothetical protein